MKILDVDTISDLNDKEQHFEDEEVINFKGGVEDPYIINLIVSAGDNINNKIDDEYTGCYETHQVLLRFFA